MPLLTMKMILNDTVASPTHGRSHRKPVDRLWGKKNNYKMLDTHQFRHTFATHHYGRIRSRENAAPMDRPPVGESLRLDHHTGHIVYMFESVGPQVDACQKEI
jgi:hypothetical protein